MYRLYTPSILITCKFPLSNKRSISVDAHAANVEKGTFFFRRLVEDLKLAHRYRRVEHRLAFFFGLLDDVLRNCQSATGSAVRETNKPSIGANQTGESRKFDFMSYSEG
jgi:hypothetical protein